MKPIALTIIAGLAIVFSASRAVAVPSWTVDPAIPGPTLPPSGRSLFDFVTADGVPFPFEALVRKIEARAGCAPAECTRSVLIPLGRSLQRTAASPDFFRFPRVVVAITREGAGPMVAKDHLYLGYQEKADAVEVISYNETAGRFEFQQVRDYRAGGARQVVYSNRNVCIACHQNHGPIFSRPVWDETNANPEVAARLRAAGAHSYALDAFRGVDTPNAIDDATDRANRVNTIQRIWREACDQSCRSMAVVAAIQYRLSGDRGFDERTPLAQQLARDFAARWPAGLAIPNADVPNRDPLAFPRDAAGMAPSHVGAAFEPLAPRPPAEVWTASDSLLARRFVVGLAELISDGDVRAVDAALPSKAAATPRRTLVASCATAGDRYLCAGDFTLRASATTIDVLTLDDSAISYLRLDTGVPTSRSLRARTTRGDLIERVVVRRKNGKPVAEMTLVEDFAWARGAIERAAWTNDAFTRGRLRSALRLAPARCCEDTGGLAAPREDAASPLPVAIPGAEFQSRCGTCHRGSDQSPPNFLAGDAARVSASLAQCAPRIFVRLAMWEIPANARDKVPMPPPASLAAPAATPDPVVAALQAKVAAWLRAETGRAPTVADMLTSGYEGLRPCLPGGG